MLLCKGFGVYVGSLLLWYEIEKNNETIQKVCKSGKNINCNAILQSNASKLFGLISWSEIGFVYFLGGGAFLISNSLSLVSITLILLFSLLAFPYVFFSLFYQWRVAKQWCTLCLTVQMIIVLEVIIGFLGNIYTSDTISQINFNFIVMALLYFTMPMVVWLILKPVIYSASENIKSKLAFTRLKHNIQLFESQLVRQRTVVHESNLLGLILGNPVGKNKLIKVCNPYCGPCASAHPEIHQLMERFPDLQVQIIFTATSSENDSKALPVRHFLAIKEQYDEVQLEKALSDWYSSKEKNYESFATKFPVDVQLDQYNPKLVDMSKWCKTNNITYTPTFFINGFELPDMYDLSDLKHLIN